MTTTRSYRAALPADVAERELRQCAGTQFDQAVVERVLGAIAPARPAPQPIVAAERTAAAAPRLAH